jgi:predicted PurR-regulated permease PerM
MVFPDRRTANILLTILAFAAVLAVLYAARRVLLIFAFAILFAYLIDPIVQFLQRHSLFFKNLRGPHVIEAYLAFLILIVLAGHMFAPSRVGIDGRLFRTVPAMLDGLSSGEIATKIGDKYGWSAAQEQRLKAILVRHREGIQKFLLDAERSASRALVVLVLVPILAIFFLADGGHMVDAFLQAISTEGNHEMIRATADDLNVMLKRYIRAKVILGGLSLIAYSVAMFVLRFPHAIALGVLGGVLEFIPVAGWMVSAALIVAVGLLTHSHWIWMAALLGVWRLAMDYFISPRVVGQNLEIHPLMVIFAVMVGGEIGGIVGIYLSIPLMVVIRVIWRRWISSTARNSSQLSHAGRTL